LFICVLFYCPDGGDSRRGLIWKATKLLSDVVVVSLGMDAVVVAGTGTGSVTSAGTDEDDVVVVE
jgi:hypothetical protein